jgi:hypothetical protein
MLRETHRTKTVGVQRLCCVVIGLILLEAGCVSGGTTRKTASMKSAKNVESSAPELSSRNQSLLAIYSAEIESAADKVILESPSPAARRQALVWKAEAIPVIQTSLLNTDPVAAVVDTWAFIFQMRGYVEQPTVKQRLGEFYPGVVDTLKNMDAEMEQIVRSVAPSANFADLRQRIGAWAEAHPIRVSLAGRRSADPELIRRTGETDLGTMGSIKALGESLGDLTARLDSYNAYLPKQARWQAELLISDVARNPQVSGALSNLAVLTSSAAKTASSMENVPELMGQAREAMRADVEGQRLAAQDFFRDERVEALGALQQERIATVAALRNERLAATEDLRGERQIVLDAVHNEQVAVMSDFKTAGDKAIQDLNASGRSLIDHFFVRALELMLLTLLLFSLAGWILMRRFAATPPDSAERIYDRAA